MTRIILTGGLGNQLFKTLGAIHFLKKSLSGLTLDITWYKNSNFYSGETAKRFFEINNFPELSRISTIEKHELFSKYESRLLSKYPSLLSHFGYITESEESLRGAFPPKVIKADFENIFSLPPKEGILKLLRFREQSSPWLKKMKILAIAETPIAIHVRRSDYLNFSETYPVLGVPYYKEAIAFMRGELGDRPLWLFSDEPHLVCAEFESEIHFDRIIVAPDNSSSVDTLELLANSFGVITANSTFSWWGAYLGCLNGAVKRVTMPEKFTLLSNDPGKNLRVPGWKII